jgi:hypothetical protein
MKEQNKELLYLDGMWLRQEHLLNLAMGVGNYAQAEHYLFALLADAVVKGKREAILEVNKVREHYGVKAIPLSDDDLEDDDDLQGKTRLTAADEQAKKLFLKMTREEKLDVLRRSMRRLLADYHLFNYARHWLAIFLVVRDRLVGESLNQTNFIALASEITPDDLPEALRIGEHTAKNFSRQLAAEDRMEAYYDMESNPQERLCDKLWDIIIQAVLTEIP